MTDQEKEQSLEAVQRYFIIAKLHLSKLFSATMDITLMDAMQHLCDAETAIDTYTTKTIQ